MLLAIINSSDDDGGDGDCLVATFVVRCIHSFDALELLLCEYCRLIMDESFSFVTKAVDVADFACRINDDDDDAC